jgi:hypothetical protein
LLLGLAAEIYFLLGDLGPGRGPARANAPSASPIGELVSRREAVKLQNEGELVWDDAHDSETLYRRQSLLTPQGGKAEVAFLDGTGLMVDENSLIVLEKTPSDDSSSYSRIIVRLMRGTLHKSAPRKSSDLLRRMGGPAGKTPEIEIDVAGTRVELTPASELTIISNPEDTGGARVIVRTGEVKIDTPSGATLMLKPGEEAKLPERGSAEAATMRKLPFTLLSPKTGQAIEASGESRPVRFRWNVTREEAAGKIQEIEVSRDAEFRSDVTSARIPAAVPPLEYVEINVTLPAISEPAQWYWRVRAKSTSEIQNFWTRPPEMPKPRYPAERARVLKESPVDFSWEPVEAATGYELEVLGRDSVSTSETFAQIRGLPVGAARWRVRARLRDGDVTSWSPARELTVTEPGDLIDQAPPPPEELSDPEIRKADPVPAPTPLHTRGFWNWLITPVYAEEPAADADAARWLVHLKWREVKGARKYHIQVSRDAAFNNVISESDTEAPEWDWNFKLGMQNSKGRAFYRVASVSAGGKVGAYSNPKSIPIPDSILGTAAKAPVAPKSAAVRKAPIAKAEVYNATDMSAGEQPVGVADAAAKGNLHTLRAAAPVAKAPHLPVAPPIDHKPKPVAAPVSITHADRIAGPSAWSWRTEAALATGYGALSQTSAAADLTSVSAESPYLQQKITIATELTRTDDLATTAWRSELQVWLAGFSKPDSVPGSVQPDFKGVGFRFESLHCWAKNAGNWNFYFGATFDRSYRWLAASNGLSVDSEGALSLGPSGRAVRTYNSSGFFGPTEVGAAFNAPLTGALTGGQLGLEGRIWGEWNLAKLSQKENPTSIGLRAEAEGAYLRWSTPTSTSTVAWTVWVAPTLRF